MYIRYSLDRWKAKINLWAARKPSFKHDLFCSVLYSLREENVWIYKSPSH